MAFSPYHAYPGWGTNEFQFGPPPGPSFVPHRSWAGADYYHAHYPYGDVSLYDYALGRVSQYPMGEYGPGLGLFDARNWHQKAYGGLCEIHEMRAEEIGHAAAYEAYRIWFHHPHIYDPFLPGAEQRRESLIGLAVAEASKILHYSSEGMDTHERMLAVECAAATASRIFYETMETGHTITNLSPSPFNPYHFEDAHHDRCYHDHDRHHHGHHSHPGVIYLPRPPFYSYHP